MFSAENTPKSKRGSSGGATPNSQSRGGSVSGAAHRKVLGKYFVHHAQELALSVHYEQNTETIEVFLTEVGHPEITLSDGGTPETLLEVLESMVETVRFWHWDDEQSQGYDQSEAPSAAQCMLATLDEFGFDKITEALVKVLTFAQAGKCGIEAESLLTRYVCQIVTNLGEATPPEPKELEKTGEFDAPASRAARAKAKSLPLQRRRIAMRKDDPHLSLPPKAVLKTVQDFCYNLKKMGLIPLLVVALDVHRSDAATITAIANALLVVLQSSFENRKAVLQDPAVFGMLLDALDACQFSEEACATLIQILDGLVDTLMPDQKELYGEVLTAVVSIVETHSHSSLVQIAGWLMLGNAARDQRQGSKQSFEIVRQKFAGGQDELFSVLATTLREHDDDQEVKDVVRMIVDRWVEQLFKQMKADRNFNGFLQLARFSCTANLDHHMTQAFETAAVVADKHQEVQITACKSACFAERLDFEEALKYAKECVTVDETWAQGYFCMGTAYNLKKDYAEDAVHCFTMALEKEDDAAQSREIHSCLVTALDTMAQFWAEQAHKLTEPPAPVYGLSVPGESIFQHDHEGNPTLRGRGEDLRVVQVVSPHSPTVIASWPTDMNGEAGI